MKSDKSINLDLNSRLLKASALLLTDPCEARKLASEIDEISNSRDQVVINEGAKYVILSSYYMRGDAENLQKYVEQYWREFKNYNSEGFKAELYRMQSLYLFLSGRSEEAKESIKEAINIFDKNNNNVQVVYCYLVQATIYQHNHEIVKAFKAYDMFIDSCEDFPEIEQYYTLYAMASMSFLFLDAGDYDEALCSIKEVYELNKKSDTINYQVSFKSYKGQANCCIKLNKLAEVPALLKSAEDVGKKLGSDQCMTFVNGIWGEYYFKKENYAEAEKYAHLASKGKIVSKGNELKDSDNYILLYCHVLSKLGRFNEVEGLLKEYIAMIERVNLDFLKETSYERIAELYKSEGLYEEACTYFNKWKEVHLKLQPSKEALRESKIERREKLRARLKDFRHNEAIYQKNEELSNFIRMASHDMKSPLKNIKQFGALMGKGNVDEEQKEYLNFIKESSEKMDRLLGDLLEYTNVGFIKDSLADIDLKSIISLVMSELEPIKEEKQINIQIGSLLTFKSDQKSVYTLIFNMISHCLSMANPESESYVKISCRDLDEFIQIIIEDNGIGIDKAQLENIFDPFTRLQLSVGHSDNSLKLATCKRIVEKLGGQIAAESALNLGSKFLISLPMA